MTDGGVVGEERDDSEQRQETDEHNEERNERRQDGQSSRLTVVDQSVVRRHCTCTITTVSYTHLTLPTILRV